MPTACCRPVRFALSHIRLWPLVMITILDTTVNARTNWSIETKGPQQLVSFIIYPIRLPAAHSELFS